LQNGVKSELQKADEWMQYNNLCSSYSKTTQMVINNNLNQSCEFKVKIRKKTLNQLHALHNKVGEMTYSCFMSRVSPLYEKLNHKINDRYILEIGKLIHSLY